MMIKRIDNPADGAARLKELLERLDAKKQPVQAIPVDDLKIKIKTQRYVVWVAGVAQYREVHEMHEMREA